MEFWDAMDKYKEKFDDQFPLYAVQDMEDDEIMAIIEKCLKENRPYTYGKQGAVY